MATSYTNNLRQALFANNDTVDEAAIWLSMVQLFEDAITGVRPLTATGGTMTLSVNNGLTDDSRQAVLAFTGTLASAQTVVIPNVPKLYVVDNATTGAFTLGLKTASSSIVNVTQGAAQWVYCNGLGSVFPVTPAVNRATGVIAGTSNAASGTNGNIQYNSGGALTGAQAVNYAASGTLVTMTAQGPTDIPHAVVGAGSQSANLAEWRQSNGTVLVSVSAAGNVATTGTLTASGALTASGPVALNNTVTSNNRIASSSPTAGIGYVTGAGGTVTQATSKSTGVTLNTASGAITLNAASLAAATTVGFTLTNSVIGADDIVIPNIKSGATAGSYSVQVGAKAAGSCVIELRNYSAGALAEAVVISFAVLKGVTA
jgi:hypothetical protein